MCLDWGVVEQAQDVETDALGLCACRQGGSMPPALPLPPGSLLVEPVFRAAPPSSSSSGAVLGAGASHFWASVRWWQKHLTGVWDLNTDRMWAQVVCRERTQGLRWTGCGVRWAGGRAAWWCYHSLGWRHPYLEANQRKGRKIHICWRTNAVSPLRSFLQDGGSSGLSPRKKAEVNLFDDLGKKDWGWPLSWC